MSFARRLHHPPRAGHSVSGLARAAVVLTAASLLLTGCLVQKLTPEQFQSLVLYFQLVQDLPAGAFTTVHTNVFHFAVLTKKKWVKVSGKLTPPEGGTLPASADVEVITSDVESGARINRFAVTARISNGTFDVVKKFKTDVPAGSMMELRVKPNGGMLAESTEVRMCVEVFESKRHARSAAGCDSGGGGGGGGNLVIVEVEDNAFSPKSVNIRPGDTVRWVLRGADPNHTTTAMAGTWDSGFVFSAEGDFFERTFPTEEDGQTFEYSCISHKACCAMQGSVRVGSSAPDPTDGY